jgi:hypothetical protein
MSVTVHGCVNWPSGEITYLNLETCLAQESCVHFKGIHAGQVALSLSGAIVNEDCNDTFYGCVNWSTGKFQVEIPEGCCVSPCFYCSPHATPATITVRFADFGLCSCNFAGYYYEKILSDPLDGDHVLTQDGANPCLWYVQEVINVTYRRYGNSICTSLTLERILTGMQIWVGKTGVNSIGVEVCLWKPVSDPMVHAIIPSGFSGLTISDCMNVSEFALNQDCGDYYNGYCRCNTGPVETYAILSSGTIEIHEGSVF